MSLTVFKFVCANGHAFEAPDASGEYGEFVMRSEKSSAPALLEAVGNAAYAEVDGMLRQLGAYRGRTEFQQADSLQAVFGIACDPAPDGTRLRIGRRPLCSVCGTREMASWEPVRPYEGPYIRVTHEQWEALSEPEKRTLLADAIEAEDNEL